MEYYCIMVRTGEEQSFKERALAALKDKFPDVQFFFFQRMMKSNKGECFERPLFPGYVFFQIEKLTAEFFTVLRHVKDFCRILRDNANPVKFTGTALEELKLFIHNGEHWGISQVQFLPGKKIRVISEPLAGLEGNIFKVNKKRKRITIMSSLTPDGKHFDLFYEDVELVE